MPAQCLDARVVTSSIEYAGAVRLDELKRLYVPLPTAKEESVTSKTNRVKGSGHWDDVQVGDSVRLSRNGHTEYRGEVDTRTEDGDIVWIKTPVGGRRLFHIADGFQLTWDQA
jgi:hypothetical protein